MTLLQHICLRVTEIGRDNDKYAHVHRDFLLDFVLSKFIWMLLQTCYGNQYGILWHGIQMKHKRNRNFEDTSFGRTTLYSVFCPGPVHAPFGIKYQHHYLWLFTKVCRSKFQKWDRVGHDFVMNA